jgi:hypothetical protein
MSEHGRASRDSPDAIRDEPSCVGVASAAGAFVISLTGEPIVWRIDVGDPDAFDDEDCLMYWGCTVTKRPRKEYWNASVRQEKRITGLSHTTLTNQRGLKGSKLGPANEGRRLSSDEAKKIEEQLRREGKIQ